MIGLPGWCQEWQSGSSAAIAGLDPPYCSVFIFLSFSFVFFEIFPPADMDESEQPTPRCRRGSEGVYIVDSGSGRYENLVLALRFEIFRVSKNRMLRSDRYLCFCNYPCNIYLFPGASSTKIKYNFFYWQI